MYRFTKAEYPYGIVESTSWNTDFTSCFVIVQVTTDNFFSSVFKFSHFKIKSFCYEKKRIQSL